MIDLRANDQTRALGGIDALPVFEPGRALWPRVVAAQQRRTRARRWRRAGASLGALGFVCAVIVLLPRAQLPAQGVAADQRESQRLEAQWRQSTDGVALDRIGFARVRGIDADLQAAYDRGGDRQALANLWRQRNEVLRGLIVRAQIVEAPTLTHI